MQTPHSTRGLFEYPFVSSNHCCVNETETRHVVVNSEFRNRWIVQRSSQYPVRSRSPIHLLAASRNESRRQKVRWGRERRRENKSLGDGRCRRSSPCTYHRCARTPTAPAARIGSLNLDTFASSPCFAHRFGAPAYIKRDPSVQGSKPTPTLKALKNKLEP